MATGNLQSTTVLEAVEESPGRSIHYREVISYGVAMTLASVADWLNEYCPTRKDYSEPASLVSPG